MTVDDEIFERFDIEFDAGPEPLFHGGELITGNLRVNLNRKITINSIRLQFKGRACWLPENSKKSEEEKVYFDKDFVLLERPPGHPEPGHFPWNANFTYSLPFECPLPKGCPTSYESPFAFVRYFARCTIETDEPTQYLVKKAFTIVSPPELRHLLPPAEQPISRQDVSTFGGCCCRGKITAELTLPKRAYAPGESVIGVLTVDNRHPRHIVEQIEVRLVDRVKKASDVPSYVIDSTSIEPITVIPDGNANTPDANNANDAVEDAAAAPPKEEKAKKVKKRAVKKYQKSNAPPIVVMKPSKHESQHRVLFVRHLEKGDVIKSKSSVTRPDLFLLTVPPVPTSIISEGAEADINDQLISLTSAVDADGRLSKLLESPSTATFRLRRQPFIRIEYALQVSIGSHLLIEVPIDVHPIPIYANGIDFRPFAAGEQPITEADEANKKTFHGPFKFVPFYSTYLAPPKPVNVLDSETITATTTTNAQVANTTTNTVMGDVPNGGISKTTTKVEAMTVELPDGSKLVHHKRQQVTTTTSSSTVTSTNPHVETHKLNPAYEIVETPFRVVIEEPQQNDNQQHISPHEIISEEVAGSSELQREEPAISPEPQREEPARSSEPQREEPARSSEPQREEPAISPKPELEEPAGSSELQHEEPQETHVEERVNQLETDNSISELDRIQEPLTSESEIVQESTVPEVEDKNQNENWITDEVVNKNQNENGITDEVVELNGKNHETVDNGTSVVEHTETEEQQLENGHSLQTTVTTKTITPANAVENGDQESTPNIIETTVEEVEYDENGDKVRVQKSTESISEQHQTLISENPEDTSNAISVE